MYRWIDDGHIDVDGTVFRLMRSRAADAVGRDEFFIFKRRSLVERYLRCAEEFLGGRVFEVGIYRGGSTAFLSAILDPEQLVAIDLSAERNVWLDRWLDDRGLTERVRLYHGVDQSDRVTIARLVQDEFGDRPLDLVIDDASHLLTPTTSTFNALFPRLRPGGLYVVEDWSWQLIWKEAFATQAGLVAQMIERRPEVLAARLRDEPDTSASGAERTEKQMWRLVFRLAIALATHEDLVTEMEMIRGFAAVRRGPLEVDPETFDLADWVADPPV